MIDDTRRTPPSDLTNDPDADNAAQSEADTQAQDVGEDARDDDLDPAEDSEPGGRANPAGVMPLDVPDLVSEMEDMVHSGRIDMGAFEGEEDMDGRDGDDS